MEQTQVPTQTVRVTGPNGEFRHDAKSAIATFNKRGTAITPSHIGQLVKAFIQGTPQYLAKGANQSNGRTNQFDRMIYNLTLTDGVKAGSPESKKLFTEGMKAEAAGDVELAHEKFNEWLNNCQMTFSVIDNPTTVRFTRGQYVQGVIGSAVNQQGENVIIIDHVTSVEAVVATKTSYVVNDFMLAD